MQLRPYQEECIASIRKNFLEGVHQQLVVAATGTGKTVIFSNVISLMRDLLPGKVLIFAHREELVDQAVKTITALNPGLKIGKEMASDYADTDCDVVVSCVASIGRNGSERLARFGNFDLVVCDEAHHSIAATYLNVFEATGVLKPESRKLLLGFTATPKRKNLTRKEQQQVTTLDEENILSLRSVYKKIVFTYPIRKAIRDGWLVPLRGFRIKTKTDLSDVKTVAGDYQQDQLSDAVNTPERNLDIVNKYKEVGENRSFVAFTVDIKHAQDLAEAFMRNGILAQAVWGVDPQRANKLQWHQEGHIKGLANAQVLTEGYDDPRVSCIILSAPTKNPSKYTQEVGRGTRLQTSTGNLLDALAAGVALEKKDCIILDVVDNSKRCSLVTLPSLLGVNPEFDAEGQDIVKVAEKIEALQEKYPGVDLTGLTSLSSVKTYIESIDILADPFTADVKEFSKLTWILGQDGTYVLAIPEKKEIAAARTFYAYLHEKLHIGQNELEEYELSITTVNDDRRLGTFNSLQEAFTAADEVVQRCRADRVKLLLRDAPWHHNLASEPVKRYLRKLTKKKPLLYCLCEGVWTTEGVCKKCKKPLGLTAGQASTALNRLQHSK